MGLECLFLCIFSLSLNNELSVTKYQLLKLVFKAPCTSAGLQYFYIYHLQKGVIKVLFEFLCKGLMSVIGEGSEREICYFFRRCFYEIITSKLFPYGCLNHVNTF